MQKTSHYQLNQWDSTDPIRWEDFNQDNAAIDGLLAANAKALSDYRTANDAAVAKKAEQSVVTALEQNTNTALYVLTVALGSSGSTCRITYGSYKGTNKSGEENPNTLSFGFYPVLVLVGSNTHAKNESSPTVMLRGQNTAKSELNADAMTVTWGDRGVSWYASGSSEQNNASLTYYSSPLAMTPMGNRRKGKTPPRANPWGCWWFICQSAIRLRCAD